MATKSKKKSLRILVANGVNLDLLGTREPAIYGSWTLNDFVKDLQSFAKQLAASEIYPTFTLEFAQSNDEAVFLKAFDGGWDGCVINAGAWTHTSIALADRLKGLGLTYVEVHISNTLEREEFRQRSFISAHSKGVMIGAGLATYRIGLVALLEALK